MTTRWFAALAASTLLSWGCQEPPKATPEAVPAAKAPDKPAAAAKPAAAKAPVAAKPAPKAVAKKAPPSPAASKLVRWDAPIEWMDWDAGLAKAKADKKPVLVMVYGDW